MAKSRISGYRRVLIDAVRPYLSEARLGAFAEAIGASRGHEGPPTDVARWSDPDNLHDSWNARSVAAAKHIPSGSTVLDIGCGKMTIERLLPEGCRYIPVDVVARDERTIVCDFNKGERPPTEGVTHVTVLGCLEYLNDPSAFWAWLQSVRRPLVLSYVDFQPSYSVKRRRAMGWVNHLKRAELIDLAIGHGYEVVSEERINGSLLFAFEPR
jgi:hypothetical protein